MYVSRKIEIPLNFFSSSPPSITSHLIDAHITQEEFAEFWTELKAKSFWLDIIIRFYFVVSIIGFFVLIALLEYHDVEEAPIVLHGAAYLIVFIIILVSLIWWSRGRRKRFIHMQNQEKWNSRGLSWRLIFVNFRIRRDMNSRLHRVVLELSILNSLYNSPDLTSSREIVYSSGTPKAGVLNHNFADEEIVMKEEQPPSNNYQNFPLY